VLVIVGCAAHLQDRDVARLVLAIAQRRFPRLQPIWADGSYAGELVTWVAGVFGWVLESVKRASQAVGFVVLPRRGVVERCLARALPPLEQGLRSTDPLQ
jgi:hypothetical protein